MRDARIAEAKAKAQSLIRASENDRITALRRIGRDLEIAKAEAERRVRDAQTKRTAVVAEVEAVVGAEVVRVQAEVAVQNERIKQVENQLQADVVAPAEAECKRAIAKARGDAARIVEDGKAQAAGTQRLAESWKAAGASAREIFLFQKLEPLLKMMAAGVPEVEVQNLTVIDAHNGSSVTKMASFLEQLRQATGVDVSRVVGNLAAGEPTRDGSLHNGQ